MKVRSSRQWELFFGTVLMSVSLAACGSGIGTPARVVLYEERQQNADPNRPRIIAHDRLAKPAATGRPTPAPKGRSTSVPEAGIPVPPPAPRGSIERVELPPLPKEAPPSGHAERKAVDAGERAAAGSADHADVPKDGLHTVQAGDTVYAVSRRYGVPVRAIIRANRLDPPYLLRVDQQVRIPTPRVHQVQRGDTAYGISREYGVAMNELMRLNEIDPPYIVVPGQVLLLPGEVEKRGEDTTVAAAPAPMAEPKSSSAEPQDQQSAAVRPPSPPPRPEEIPRPAPREGKDFLWPVRGTVISGFGPRGKGLHNDGINIQAPRGAPVRAAENGVVVYVGNELRGYGKLVLIRHADGYMTAYGHNDSVLVSRGQEVRRGETIARVGSTGNVETPQLHFEIRKARRAVDPVRYLSVHS